MLTGCSQNERQGQFQMLLDETKCQKIRILYLDYMDHAVLVYNSNNSKIKGPYQNLHLDQRFPHYHCHLQLP